MATGGVTAPRDGGRVAATIVRVRRRRQRGLAGPPRGSSRRAAGLAAAAVVGAGGIVALLRWKLWSAGVPDVDAARLADWFDPAELARNRDYRRGVWTMAAIGAPLGAAAAIGVALLGAALAAGPGARGPGAALARGHPLRRRPGGRHDRRSRCRCRSPATPGGATTGSSPRASRDGCSISQRAWGCRSSSPARSGAAWRSRSHGRPAGGGRSSPPAPGRWSTRCRCSRPLVFEPLFQRTEPLRDPALSAQILALARSAGVQADDVKVNDASARTTAANAYVSGLGGSRHIVLFDTLLRDFPRDQVRMVVAHELAHVERRHVLKGSTWGAALRGPGGAPGLRRGRLAHRLRPGGARRGGHRPGAAAAGDRRGVGGRDLGVRSAPLTNWVSRAYEREADWRGLALAGDPGADIACSRGWSSAASASPTRPRPCRSGSAPTRRRSSGSPWPCAPATRSG